MIRLPLAATLTFAALPVATAAAPSPVAYTLSPEVHGGAITALKVEVRFAGDADGTTDFAWAREWAGEERLWQWTRDLKVEGARRVTDRGEGRWRILAAPRVPITVRYRIVSAFASDPDVGTSDQARPVVRPRWFFAVGEALFGQPQGRGNAPATFAWDARGTGIGFASDLEHLAGPGRKATRPGGLDDVAESIVIGGHDLHLAGSLASPSRVRVASVGRYDFKPEALDTLALRVIAAERAFWGDEGAPFLVAASPLVSLPGRLSYGGTGRSDAFALWIDRAAPIESMRWLLAHEYFHSWDPRQIGGESEDTAPGKWIDEGFTDYYARALTARSGLVTPAEFAALWNDTLLAYAASPARNMPGIEAGKAFWKNEDAQKLPYYRGALLAALWNARLRAASSGRAGVDDIVRAMRTAKDRPGTAAALFPTVAQSFGLDVTADLQRYILDGETITLPRDTFGPCAEVRSSTRPDFTRGYQSRGDGKGGSIADKVDPDGPAYAAGLRDGMAIVKREAGEPGNSTVEYALRVRDATGERVVRFMPAGRRTLTVQQVVLKPNADARCGATLSGLAG